MEQNAPLKSGGVWAGGEEYSKYKQQVVEMLKAGQLVVQMLAAEETITMPDGSRKATFTQETWDMVRHVLEKLQKQHIGDACHREFPGQSKATSNTVCRNSMVLHLLCCLPHHEALAATAAA